MIQIIFENENFIVCDKPAMVLSVPDRLGPESQRSCLGIQLQKQMKNPIFPVHRLDFEVSGLIMFAKNGKAHQISQDWFQKRTLKKYYHAQTLQQNFDFLSTWPDSAKKKIDQVIISDQPGQSFKWTSKIVRGKRRSFEADHGEIATTLATLKSREESPDPVILNWILEPVTGKPHQLRYELCKRGFPILGDVLYGSTQRPIGEAGIALRAVKLDLTAIKDRLDLPEIIEVSDSILVK